ncbi:hypothetical protein GW17_00008628 [Ensete ventricosum]|nr:hypothetical protein GW17_00008628 [Ensete ventricosum]
MNALPKPEKRTSKASLAKKRESKKKPSPRNPLKELNNSSIPPLGSAEPPKRGCVRFLLSDSSAKESLARSRSMPRTPRSAPPNHKNVASNPKNSTNGARFRSSQKNASKSNLELPKELGSRKTSKSRPPDLFPRWSKRKPSSNVENPHPRLNLERGSEGKVGSCLASTPERSLLGSDSAKEGQRKMMSTPTPATTPPVQASISPEVTMEASAVAATPVCFAAGHVIARVHDRRKCRPRGILTIGRDEPEIGKIHGGCPYPTLVSVTPPPLAGASIHWLSSPSENVSSGLGSSFDSSSKVLAAHCSAEASVEWLPRSCEDGDNMPKDESLMGYWRSSPDDSSRKKSPELRGLLGLNSPALETTPSSGIGIQRTPPAGGTVSPFSIILERTAKRSKSKLVRPQQEMGGFFHGSEDSSNEVHLICKPSSFSSSMKKQNLADSKMDAMAEALETTSTSCQAPLPGLSFLLHTLENPSSSVDLDRFQNLPCDRISTLNDDACAKEEILPSSQASISWREGTVSRIFEMGELDHCQWLSEDENSFIHHEEDRVRSIPDLEVDLKNISSTLKKQNEHIAAPSGFGSVEFVFEAEKSEAKVLPPQGPISCAESISIEGLVVDSSGDSDWAFFNRTPLM